MENHLKNLDFFVVGLEVDQSQFEVGLPAVSGEPGRRLVVGERGGHEEEEV